jgi:hypothetical protein
MPLGGGAPAAGRDGWCSPFSKTGLADSEVTIAEPLSPTGSATPAGSRATSETGVSVGEDVVFPL